jgi:hypothetical protein
VGLKIWTQRGAQMNGSQSMFEDIVRNNDYGKYLIAATNCGDQYPAIVIR